MSSLLTITHSAWATLFIVRYSLILPSQQLVKHLSCANVLPYLYLDTAVCLRYLLAVLKFEGRALNFSIRTITAKFRSHGHFAVPCVYIKSRNPWERPPFSQMTVSRRLSFLLSSCIWFQFEILLYILRAIRAPGRKGALSFAF